MNAISTTTSWLRRHLLASALAAVVVVGAAAYAAFGIFGVHTLFVDDVVDEADPFAVTTVTDDAEPATGGVEPAAEQPAEGTSGGDGTGGGEAPQPVVETLAAGSFIDRSHPASGQALVLTDGTQRVLRLEDFATDNGPDLNVYLVAAPPDTAEGELAADHVDLGDLKGNIGDQNYEIPDGVDLSRYRTVVIWCVRFGVAFGAAGLEAPAS